ncbi:MAG: tRNA glutamyl-Q(34) synthetase GluQRS [Alphaproteobacteria bacterium]
MQPVFRFAPSPNGRLHLGHVYAALRDFDLCRRAGGRFLLRIEDIDPTRSRPEYEAAIYDDLAWLGLSWEAPVMRQSTRMPIYAAQVERLRADDSLYPAFMSRAEARHATDTIDWPRDPDGSGLYPPDDRNLAAADIAQRLSHNTAHTWRMDMGAVMQHAPPLSWMEDGAGPADETGQITADPRAWGDVVIARRDVPTSYHLAVVVDDAAQGVTHIVRGRDLFYATAIHVLLQHLLGLPTPRYHHHRLITDGDGNKLSKSYRDTPLVELRDQGATPADVRKLVGL